MKMGISNEYLDYIPNYMKFTKKEEQELHKVNPYIISFFNGIKHGFMVFIVLLIILGITYLIKWLQV